MDVVILRVTTAVVSAGIVCIADNGSGWPPIATVYSAQYTLPIRHAVILHGGMAYGSFLMHCEPPQCHSVVQEIMHCRYTGCTTWY